MSVLNYPKEIQIVLDIGFALVPSNIRNKDGKPKVPWASWKRCTERLTAIQLLDEMYKTEADSVAVLAGKLSGELVILDIDTKYKEGIDARVFSDIKEWYPDLISKLRIEKTPSGGYHIYYRVELEGHDFPSYSGVLAGRSATENELELKPTTTTYGFIEQKNICQCYPTVGYLIVREGIGVLSWSEHSSLINLCKDYDERIEKNHIWVKPTKSDSDFYDESPWISFNNGRDADQVLDKFGGWRRRSDKENANRVYFIKPGKEATYKEDGAVFRKDKGWYVIYTTSGGVKDGCYSPANLLLEVKFDGNKKDCWAWLVSEGYGIIKSSREKALIKKAVGLGKGLESLPKNVSALAKEEIEEEIRRIGTDYRYGIFWVLGEDEVWRIDREALYFVSEKLGFRINDGEVCWINDYIVEVVTDRFYFDELKKYMGNCDKNIKNCYETFIQNSGKFTVSRLPILDKTMMLESTRDISYKPYANGYVRVSTEGWCLLPYDELNGRLIWKNLIQDRDYVECTEEAAKEGLYWRFLDKAFACGVCEYLYSIIGFYAHDYKSTNTPYIVILCEMCDNPKDGGGSGKNLFTNLFRLTSSVLNKPAKGIKFDDTMLRTRKQEKILSINDAEKKFDYLALREFASGEGEVGKKYMQEITLANKDMPKLIVNTNYSFNPNQPGLKRRLISAELTDFFTKCGGVDVYFGVDFPNKADSEHGWTERDFIGYDWVVLRSIQEFIKSKCKLKSRPLTDGGWTKQVGLCMLRKRVYGYACLWMTNAGARSIRYISRNKSTTVTTNHLQCVHLYFGTIDNGLSYLVDNPRTINIHRPVFVTQCLQGIKQCVTQINNVILGLQLSFHLLLTSC